MSAYAFRLGVLAAMSAFAALTAVHAATAPAVRIAVFADAGAPVVGAPSDPDYLAAELRRVGWQVEKVDAAALASPQRFNAREFDVVVLPYGPAFPEPAADNFLRFLREGGDFVSMGGYAFDELYGAPKPASENLVGNAGFEEGLQGWSPPQAPGVACQVDGEVAHSGSASCRITVGARAQVTWHTVLQKVTTVSPGKHYRASCWIRTEGVRDGYAYMAVNFYAADGRRISFVHGATPAQMTGDQGWQQSVVELTTPAGTAWLTLVGINYGRGAAWFDDFELRPSRQQRRLNTHFGVARDQIHVTPEQLGVFDASYRLRRVAYAQANPGQSIVPSDLRLEGGFAGYAASGLIATRGAVTPMPRARWTSLIQCYDRYGRQRGSLGALQQNYAGLYRGSQWAYFGADNVDLFSPQTPQMMAALRRVIAHMVRGVFLREPATDLMCYHQGESVTASVHVENFGVSDWPGRVRFVITPMDAETVVWERAVATRAAAGQSVVVTGRWEPPRFEHAAYRVRAELRGEYGSLIDAEETGIVVWDEATLKEGFPLRYAGNYFRAGERPMFLTGTNQTGVVLGPWYENPLAWRREFALMQDLGMNVLRVLHISPYADPGYPEKSRTNIEHPGKSMLRRFDALVQMAQAHRIIVFPCVHDWTGGISVSDEMLRREQAFARQFCRRYRDVPGIIYDISNEAALGVVDEPDLRRLFNRFLRQRHGTDAKLRQAWGEPLKLGAVPFAAGPPAWDSRRNIDVMQFCTQVAKRWVKANVEAIREGDSNHPVTNEYYLMPGGDAFEAREWLDFANIHCYSLWQPERMKFYDRRMQGRSFAVGEFGKRHHPGLAPTGWGYAPEPAVLNHFLKVAHFAFGVGGSMALNWDWKDMEGCLFPWGLMYPSDLTPKDVAYVWRACGLFFRQLRPQYRPPEVAVVIPDTHLLGRQPQRVPRGPVAVAVENCIDRLFRCHVGFGVVREYELGRLPAETRVLFYPAPFTLSDATFQRLRAWVAAGGRLYISGDLSYDETRRRTRERRLTDLCGVRGVRIRYPNIEWRSADAVVVGPTSAGEDIRPWEARPCLELSLDGARSLVVDAKGQPVLTVHQVGNGSVFYNTDPIEFHLPPAETSLYRACLRQAGIESVRIDPDSAALRVFAVTLENDGRAIIVHNAGQTTVRIDVEGIAQVDVPPDLVSVTALNDRGKVVALGGAGRAETNGRLLFDADGFAMAFSLSGEPVAEAAEMMAVAFEEGPLRLPAAEKRAPVFGEFRGGRWHALERLPTGGSIDIDQDRRLTPLLIGDGARQPRLDVLR